MAQFKTISFGQNGWDKDINDNFKNVVQDTGWQELPLVGNTTGKLSIRVVNGVAFFSGSIAPNVTDGTVIMFPTQLSNKHIIGINSTTNALQSFYIRPDGGLAVGGLTDATKSNSISFDGMSIYVGNISLGGQ